MHVVCVSDGCSDDCKYPWIFCFQHRAWAVSKSIFVHDPMKVCKNQEPDGSACDFCSFSVWLKFRWRLHLYICSESSVRSSSCSTFFPNTSIRLFEWWLNTWPKFAHFVKFQSAHQLIINWTLNSITWSERRDWLDGITPFRNQLYAPFASVCFIAIIHRIWNAYIQYGSLGKVLAMLHFILIEEPSQRI